MRKIKKGDNVVVLSGRDKGKRGDVTRVLADHVLVAGVNQVKKHQRPNPNKGTTGGIVEMEGPIHVSNVMLVDPDSGEPSRIAIKREGGRRMRVAKKSGSEID